MLRFLGIGAQKAGTTWLYRALDRHPHISFPLGKESHYWDWYRDTKEFSWYEQHFVDPDQFEGEITPSYSFLPLNVIERISERWGDLRLIYFIRDPRARAWSAARMSLKRAEMTHQEASDQWFIDHFNSQGSRSRGDYEACIRNWRHFFEERQLLIVRYEDLCANPVCVANKCLSHIGVADKFFSKNDDPVLRVLQHAGDRVELRPSLKEVLNKIYRDQIISLQEYLGQDFSGWMD